jgi:DNA-binding MarR family transcriptional regulator
MKIVDLQNNFDNRKQKWPWLISMAKRHFDIWVTSTACKHLGDFKVSYMPFIANVDPNGSTNNSIANAAKLTKQGMSRTIAELEGHGLIKTEKNLKDKRSTNIKLSKKGEKFMNSAFGEVQQLTETYKKLVGEKNYTIAIDVIAKIVAYHEGLLGGKNT